MKITPSKILPLKNLLLRNAPLKIICLALGYSFWHIASLDHTISIQTSVPLCFTANTHSYTVLAPEKIDVTLTGKRSDLYAIEKDFLAAHVSINKLLPGKHGIIINRRNLFLPDTIAVSHCKPSNISITIVDKKTT